MANFIFRLYNYETKEKPIGPQKTLGVFGKTAGIILKIVLANFRIPLGEMGIVTDSRDLYALAARVIPADDGLRESLYHIMSQAAATMVGLDNPEYCLEHWPDNICKV